MSADKLEVAASGRARCRSCGEKIDKDTLRFGEVLPRPSGDDDATSVFWYHPRCAAHRRPEKFAHLLREGEIAVALPGRDELLAEADQGIAHSRLARIAGAERATSGRARCRHCKEAIAQGLWRVRLSAFAESGFPDPLGFIHASCCAGYFGVAAVSARVLQACPGLDAAAAAEVSQAVDAVAEGDPPPADGGDAGPP